jgi:hypothetical protein
MCTAFGPKSGERWSTALDGYAIDIESGDIVWRGVEHPHSLTAGADDLYVAESRRGRVRGRQHGRRIEVEGYPRGLAFAVDGLMVVGISRGRNRSRSLGTIENAADPGDEAGASGVVVIEPTGPASVAGSIRYLNLSAFGPEVYDVLLLPPGNDRRPHW